MDPLKSILRNSSLLIAAQAVSSTLGMLFLALVPRSLGDTEFGHLHLALSLAMMFAVGAEFGLPAVIARAVSQNRGLTRAYLRAGLVLTTLVGMACYAALLGAIAVLGYAPRVRELAALLGISMVAEALAQLLGALFQAHERMLVPAVSRIVANVVLLGAAVPLLRHGAGAATVATLMVGAAMVRLGLQALGARALEGCGMPATARLSWQALAAQGMPFLVWQALGIVYFRMDIVMLGWLAPAAVVGWYGAGSRLTDALTFVPNLLTMATFPVAARLWIAAPGEFRQTIRHALQVLLVVTMPFAVVLLTLAHEVVDLLFTVQAFGPTVPILRIQAFTLVLLFVDFYLVGLLMAIGRERAWIKVAAAACLVSPILNWLLITMAGARLGNAGIGAALATLLVETFIMVSALRLFPQGAIGRDSLQVAGRAVAAAGAMAGTVVLARGLGVPWVAAFLLGGLAYVALVIRLGLLPDHVAGWLVGRVSRRSPAGTPEAVP